MQPGCRGARTCNGFALPPTPSERPSLPPVRDWLIHRRECMCVVCCVMHGGLGWIISAMIIVSGRVPGCPRYFRLELHKHTAAEKPFPSCTLSQRVLTQHIQHDWRVICKHCPLFLTNIWILSNQYSIILVCGFSTIHLLFHPSFLTRFLKSAVTSLVNTARLRKPVETSLLSWVRWLFPKFSRTSMYCSLFSTWAEKNTQAKWA